MPGSLAARFEQMQTADADRSAWIKFSLVVLETLMKQQAAVMEVHRELFANTLDITSDAHHALRSHARDGLDRVNRLADLYQQVQSKIRADRA